MSQTRIYLVVDEFADTPRRYLVRAGNPAQAARHVTRGQYRITVADQDALVSALSDGVRVEDASADE